MAALKIWDGSSWVTLPAGVGVPAGGTAGQHLRKTSSTNYDTAWATPLASETSLTTVTHLSSTDVQDAISRMPKGVISLTQSTSTLGPVSSTTTGFLSASVSVNVLRLYRIVFVGAPQFSVAGAAGDRWIGQISDGTSVIGNVFDITTSNTTALSTTFNIDRINSFLWRPSTGTFTVSLTLFENNGTSSCQVTAAATAPAQLYIEDVGLR